MNPDQKHWFCPVGWEAFSRLLCRNAKSQNRLFFKALLQAREEFFHSHASFEYLFPPIWVKLCHGKWFFSGPVESRLSAWQGYDLGPLSPSSTHLGDSSGRQPVLHEQSLRQQMLIVGRSRQREFSSYLDFRMWCLYLAVDSRLWSYLKPEKSCDFQASKLQTFVSCLEDCVEEDSVERRWCQEEAGGGSKRWEVSLAKGPVLSATHWCSSTKTATVGAGGKRTILEMSLRGVGPAAWPFAYCACAGLDESSHFWLVFLETSLVALTACCHRWQLPLSRQD